MDAELKGLLRRPTFVWFLGSRLCSGISSQMLLVALAWNIYDLTHSAWDLGLVGLYQFIPALVMTLPAGHAADRWNRVRNGRDGSRNLRRQGVAGWKSLDHRKVDRRPVYERPGAKSRYN